MNSYEPTGRLLLNAFRAFEALVLQDLQKAGYSDITLSHLNLIRHLEPQGMRLSHLAKDATLSKQAVSKIAADLAGKAYIKIVEDKSDGRAKLIQYAPKGKKMIEKAIKIVDETELMYKDLLGSKELDELRCKLLSITHYSEKQ